MVLDDYRRVCAENVMLTEKLVLINRQLADLQHRFNMIQVAQSKASFISDLKLEDGKTFDWNTLTIK